MSRGRLMAVLVALACLFVAMHLIRSAPDATQIADQSTAAEIERSRLPSAGTVPGAPATDGEAEGAESIDVLALSPDDQADHVATLRRLANAGVAAAAWRMADFTSRCFNSPPWSDAEVEAKIAEMDRQAEERGDPGVPELVAQRDREMWRSTRWARRLCAQIEPTDVDRQMDWIELALARRHPELFMRMTFGGVFVFPDEQAWRVRHAERLAVFVERARRGFAAQIELGDSALLRRAEFFYGNTDGLLGPNDDYQALVHAFAAAYLPPVGDEWRPDEAHLLRFRARSLTPEQVEAARADARALYQRCCAAGR